MDALEALNARALVARVAALEGQVLSSLYASVMVACRILTESGHFENASYLIAQPTYDTSGRAVCILDCLHDDNQNEGLLAMFDEMLCGFGLDTESDDDGAWKLAVRFVEPR